MMKGSAYNPNTGEPEQEGHEFEASQDTEEREGVRGNWREKETKGEIGKQSPSACLLRAVWAKTGRGPPLSPFSTTAAPSKQESSCYRVLKYSNTQLSE